MADLSSGLFQGLPPTALLPAGQYGLSGAPGATARLVTDVSAATLVARRGAGETLAARCAEAGLPLPMGPKATIAGGLTLVGTGPGRWLAFAEATAPDALLRRLASITLGAAALTDQSDANLLFELSGAAIRAALAKGVMLDLDPLAFGVGDAATTSVSLVGVTFWQVDAAPAYRFAVARSFAPAFLRWLAASAAEYGFALESTGRG